MPSQDQPTERPRFTGASLYNSPNGMLSFWYATEWRLETADTPCQTVTLTPDHRDPATNITITINDIEKTLSRGERNFIRDGIKAGLAQLEDCHLERLDPLDEQGRWGLEWECTFAFDGQRRRRRARLFFSDHYQYAVTLQGATEERYAYWQGMFEFTLLTVNTASFNAFGYLNSPAPQQS